MGVIVAHRAIDPIGVKGRDGSTIATNANPFPTSIAAINENLHRYLIRADADTFGSAIAMPRVNQTDTQFHKNSDPDLLVNVVAKTGSASSTRTAGLGVFNSGTDTDMEYLVKSRTTINYSSAHEIYAYVTAHWTTPPSSANDLALVGILNETGGAVQNEYMVGYKGTSFGVRYIRGASEVSFTAQASFSEDPIDGSAGSTYTLNGSPVALDPTKTQVFRIRFGWLSAAPTHFEIMAPDGHWVVFHIIKHPNTLTVAQTTTPNMNIGMHLLKSASDATDIQVSTGCWGGGIVNNIPVGLQSDGEYVAEKADGLAFDRVGNSVESSAELIAAGTFQSDWVDTDGWATIQLNIASNVVSATDGILFEFTDDVGAATPVVRDSRAFTFTADDVVNGSLDRTIQTRLDGFRLTYTNGGTGTSGFYISTTLRTAPQPPQNTLKSDIAPTSTVADGRTAVYAENDTSVFGLIKRSDLGGLRTSILEYEVETPIRGLDSIELTTSTVGSTAVQIIAASSVPAGTRSIEFHASPANTKDITINTSSAVTLGSGRRMDPGGGVVWELTDDYVGEVWAIYDGMGGGLTTTFIKDSNPP